MRRLQRAGFIALALACAALPLALDARPASAAPSVAPARAAVVFLPSPHRAIKGKPFLERVAAIPGIPTLGFLSAIQGPYTPEQVLLDIGAGTRVANGLYDGDLPERLALERAGKGWEIGEWPRVTARADTPPADIEPGILGQAVRDAGGSVGYAGLRGSGNREAIVAADRAGQVQRVSLGDGRSEARRATALWRQVGFLVVKLPPRAAGRAALEALIAARRPQDLLIVIQDPNAVPRRLLAAGAAGLEGDGKDLRSASTRTDGLVVTTDIAPTVLERLGARIPKAVSGEPLEASGDRSAADLVDLRRRLGVVGPRRWGVVLGSLAGAIALIALATRRARTVGRGALLAALWLPSALLVTGAIAPAAWLEALLLAVSCAALALLTDRLLPWPRAVAVPAAVTVGLHALDLAFGSTFIVRSLLGPNPLLGARFYGIGNELEITLAVTTLLGLGAALAGRERRAAVWGFALGGMLVAFLLSWGRLGADVGAALTLGVGTAAGAVLAAERGSWRTRAAIVLGAPALALALLAGLDLATGGNAHFTRSVLKAGGLDELGQVAQRRFELSYSSLGRGIIGPLVVVAAIAVIAGIRRREQLLAPLDGIPAMRAGLYGALAAVVAGALTNDSGPVIFLIGTTYLALAVGYVRSAPKKAALAAAPREPLLTAQE